MKSIRAFIEGKIRRSEADDRVRFDVDPSHDSRDPELGCEEGALFGPAGNAVFYEKGLMTQDRDRIHYEDIVRVLRVEGRVFIELRTGTTKPVATSHEGGEVLYAALRWIGHTRLGRTIAE